MFLEYYGMREQPFGVTPDPRYLYFSAMHREALASLYYGIETGCGFLTLIAPPGMGKTTLLLHLLERLRRSTRTVFLFQTQCDSREFMRYLLTDLGVDASDQNMAHMHEALNSVLLSNARIGRRFVLIIDEAQNLKKTVLETVRLLSDFETPAAKLIQVVLSGQPHLADRLSHPDLMQLRQRISIVSRLHPFTRMEMMRYIHHRLNVAGYSGPPLFTYEAVDQIMALSGGVPRNINNICFNALTLGYAMRQKQIKRSIVSEVLADLDIDALSSHSVAPAFATQDSSSSVDGLGPTDEATYQDFHSTARTAWVNGVEGGATEGHTESDPIPMTPVGDSNPPDWVKGVEGGAIEGHAQSDPVPMTPGGDSNPPVAVSQRDSSELAVAKLPLGKKAASAEEIVAFLGSLRKRWKLTATCGAVLFVAGIGGVPFFYHESVGDGVVDSTLAPGAQVIPRSNPVVHVDPASENLKTVSTNPPKDTIPSVRAQRQQRPPMKQSIPSVTSDVFGAPNSHPVSTRPAAAAQADTASSSHAGLVFSDKKVNELPEYISSNDGVVLPSPAYNQDGLFSVDGQAKQPELLSIVPLQYPPVARRRRVEGDVVVNFVVEESGNVSDVNIVSGPMMLRQAALNALRSWKYKPSQLAGQPIAVKMQVTIGFHLP